MFRAVKSNKYENYENFLHFGFHIIEYRARGKTFARNYTKKEMRYVCVIIAIFAATGF